MLATSGYGIAAAAHRGSLASQGHPVAITAAGVDRPYPSAHKDLLEEISRQGLVVSETPPGKASARTQMLASNRLVAALATTTVVVEAAHRSGALNVAGWAEDLGRTLHAVPGPITSAASAGTHHLIASGRAQLLGDPADLGRSTSQAAESIDESFLPNPIATAARAGSVPPQHQPHRAPVR